MTSLISEELISSLRSTWNAPKRQVLFTPPEINSEWQFKFDTAKNQIKPGKGVTLGFVGGRGNGKTQMAVELMRILTENGHSAYFTTAAQLFMELKDSRPWNKDAEFSELDVVTKYRKPRLMVIDEFGKSSDAPWLNSVVFDLLNWRHNDVKDTILIDNNTLTDFEILVGPSMASRINQGGGIIEFTWPSFRQ